MTRSHRGMAVVPPPPESVTPVEPAAPTVPSADGTSDCSDCAGLVRCTKHGVYHCPGCREVHETKALLEAHLSLSPDCDRRRAKGRGER